MATTSFDIAFACIEQNILNNTPTMLWGPPGVGKSQGYEQLTRKLKYGYIDFRLSLRAEVDIRGLPSISGSTTKWLTPDELPQVKRDGPKGLLVLEEITAASPAMMNAALGLVLERRVGEYRLPGGWVPVANGNRMIDRAAVNKMPAPLMNRFAHYEIEAEHRSWDDWAVRNKVHPAMIAFLRWRPGLLHIMPGQKTPDGVIVPVDEKAFPTPRTIVEASKYTNTPAPLRQNLVAALCGDHFAMQYEAYLLGYKNLPSLTQVLDAPETARVPGYDQPGALYAVSTMLSMHLTPKNADAISKYAARLPKEYEIMLFGDAVKRNVAIQKTPGFVNFASRNAKVMT